MPERYQAEVVWSQACERPSQHMVVNQDSRAILLGRRRAHHRGREKVLIILKPHSRRSALAVSSSGCAEALVGRGEGLRIVVGSVVVRSPDSFGHQNRVGVDLVPLMIVLVAGRERELVRLVADGLVAGCRGIGSEGCGHWVEVCLGLGRVLSRCRVFIICWGCLWQRKRRREVVARRDTVGGVSVAVEVGIQRTGVRNLQGLQLIVSLELTLRGWCFGQKAWWRLAAVATVSGLGQLIPRSGPRPQINRSRVWISMHCAYVVKFWRY